MKLPQALRDEAEREGYQYFDSHIRALPKKPDGSIDTQLPGFGDNDVDAFRHAYVSGVLTHEYGEQVATLLGWMNELMPSSDSGRGRNMDLWNNEIGRKLALKHKTRKALLAAIKHALESGQLITNLSDDRAYGEALVPRPEGESSVVVLQESESGSNQWFFDLTNSKTMSREEFVREIEAGHYPSYGIRRLKGTEYPVSKRDKSAKNNLG